MRKPVVMGNWKLNGTKQSVTELVQAFVAPANLAATKVDLDFSGALRIVISTLKVLSPVKILLLC